MTFTASDVMKRAATTLQDLGNVRWPVSELHDYLNDGLREVVRIKPNARSKTVNLNLAAGTLQTLPPEYTILSRVSRNMADANTGAEAIRALDSRSIMDAQIPNWQSASALPFSKTVIHVIHDTASPSSFYVVPGNDGTGIVEAVVGCLPQPSPVPGANPDQISSYSDEVDIPDIYQNALTDYILYLAYSKDARISGSAARAQAHYELFSQAVMGFGGVEDAMSLGTHVKTIQQARES